MVLFRRSEQVSDDFEKVSSDLFKMGRENQVSLDLNDVPKQNHESLALRLPTIHPAHFHLTFLLWMNRSKCFHWTQSMYKLIVMVHSRQSCQFILVASGDHTVECVVQLLEYHLAVNIAHSVYIC